MSTRVQAAEIEATYPEPEDAHALKIAELEATTATAREGVDHLTAQLQDLETQRTAVKEHLQQLSDKEKELEKLIYTVEPRIRYALLMYLKLKLSVFIKGVAESLSIFLLPPPPLLLTLLFTTSPFCRHTMSLYAHVSQIVWNFEQRDRVAGVIDDPSQSNMDTFDLGDMVTFDSVNTLWGLICGGGGKKS
jgi:hypothetical protein